MNFIFKKQDFQTEAVNAVCEVFAGQGKQGLTEYGRDLGKRATPVQATLFDEEDDGLGYRNADVDMFLNYIIMLPTLIILTQVTVPGVTPCSTAGRVRSNIRGSFQTCSF